MPYPRKLPDDDVLRKQFEAGKTNKEIAAEYGVTTEAVRLKRNDLGFQPPRTRPNHGHYLPWRMRQGPEHAANLLARRLRAYSKSQQDLPLTDEQTRLLAEWQAWMDGGNRWGLPMSVHYDRDTGFWLEPRKPGDRDYIHPPGVDD